MVIQRLDERTCSGFAALEALDAKGRRATATENLKPPVALLPGVLSGDGGVVSQVIEDACRAS